VHDVEATNVALADVKFSEILVPPATLPLPPARPQQTTSWRPSSLRDLLLPRAYERLTAWLKANMLDMLDMLQGDANSPRPHKPEPVVFAESEVVPEGRGVVWDLRDPNNIVPLDTTAPVISDLNLPFIKMLLAGCQDRELVDHITRGVSFKADLPLHAVLLPHQDSLAGHMELVKKEVATMEERGWVDVIGTLPFFPIRLQPNGTVVRKHEPDRPRCFTNASAPFESSAMVDDDGVPVRSLNAAVLSNTSQESAAQGGGVPTAGDKAGAPPPTPKWPKEQKPEVLNKVHDINILRFAAKVFGTECYGFVTDWASFFMQFATAPAEHWKSVRHTCAQAGVPESDIDPDGSIGLFVCEYRLGFGCSASSNVCQRFAHALAEVFRKLFDAEEALVTASESDAARLAFLEQRRALGPKQDRLYEISVYTDDPMAVFVGPDRLARGLKLWHRLCDAIGLETALPCKRQCGVALRWLGLDFLLTEGILLLPDNKRTRAIKELTAIKEGEVTRFGDYRSTIGFLVHLRPFVAGIDKTLLYGMYTPFKVDRLGRAPEAGTIVKLSTKIQDQAARWIHILRNVTGMFFSATLTPAPPVPSMVTNHLYSDAALRGSGKPGIGGYLHGFYWAIELDERATRLPISALEFIAIVVGVIVFEPLVRGEENVICTDSLNCVQVLSSGRSKSEIMQHVHVEFLALPETASMKAAEIVRHTFGPANPLADAASRAKWAELKAWCSQLGIVPCRLEVLSRALDILESAIAMGEALGLPFQDVDGDATCREPDSARPTPEQPSARGAAFLARMARQGGAYSSDNDSDGPTPRVKRPHPRVLAAAATVAATSPVRAEEIRATRVGLQGTSTLPSRFVPSSRGACGELQGGNLSRPSWRPTGHAGTMEGSTLPPARKRRPLPATFRSEKRLCAAKVEPPRMPEPTLGGRGRRTSSGSCVPANGPSLQYIPMARRQRPSPACTHAATRLVASGTPATLHVVPSTRGTRANPHADARLSVIETRAQELFHLLLADDTPLALRPVDDSTILYLCRATLEAAEAKVAAGTVVKDDLAWTRWVRYCSSVWKTPPFRSDIRANAGLDVVGGHREAILLSGFLMHMASTVPSRGGKGHCKPQTALDLVLAIKRIHKRLGAPMGILPEVRGTFQGIIKRYVAIHGTDALQAKRKEPMTDAILSRILALGGVSIGRRTLDWSDLFFVVFKAILCAGLSSGMRKAEMTFASGTQFDATQISRASVTWIIAGIPVASPTPAQLRGLAAGDYCGIVPGVAKNDPYALHFGWKPIWLPVHDAPTNAARAIAEMFLAVPVPSEAAATTPLFSLTPDGVPLRHRAADSTLAFLLKAAMPGEDPSKWSMHSLRIGAATALLAAGASTDLIMAMCRWRSPGSVLLYGRMGPTDYGAWVLKAQQAKVDATTARNLPRLDYDGVFEILNEGVQLDWESPP